MLKFSKHYFLTANSLQTKDFLTLLKHPLSFRKGRKLLIDSLSHFFNIPSERIFLFNAGRMGLFLALKSLGVKSTDEIIVPGYTCVVVTNAIKYLEANVKYVDINPETLNIDTTKLEKAITSKTRAIVIPHNFGIPYDDILYLKEKYPELIIIEDCAHSLGSKLINGKLTGTIGDFAFFSLEYSKPITSGMGGILIVNNDLFVEKIKIYYEQIPYYPFSYELKILLTLISIVLGNDIGSQYFYKGLLFLLRKLNLKFITPQKEILGFKPKYYPSKLSDIRAYIAYLQMRKLQKIIDIKKEIAKAYFEIFQEIPNLKQFYNNRAVYVRYPILLPQTSDRNQILSKLRRTLPFEIGIWFNDVVHPAGSLRYCYLDGLCQIGEEIAQRILNFPVNIRFSSERIKDLKGVLINAFREIVRNI